MSAPPEPVTTTSSSVTPFYGGGIVQQSHSAAANATDVAASTTTAISFPGGSGTRSSAAAASGGNVAAIQTTTTEKDTTSETSVDEDPRAKLMFYLDCVACVLEGFHGLCREVVKDLTHDELMLLRGYTNFHQLTTEQFDKVLILAETFPPKLFINNLFFENEEKCKNLTNRFYNIEEIERTLAIQNEFVFHGLERHVSKIMYYKAIYLERNYYKPMRYLEHRLRIIKRGQHLETFSENYKVHLFVSLLFPFWVIVWTAMCVYESKPDVSSPSQEDVEA